MFNIPLLGLGVTWKYYTIFMIITATKYRDMKIQVTGAKTGFVCKSLVWSLMLYGCITCICHWQEITALFGNKENTPVAYTNSTDNTITTVRINTDSLQKHIRIADGVIKYLRVYLNY